MKAIKVVVIKDGNSQKGVLKGFSKEIVDKAEKLLRDNPDFELTIEDILLNTAAALASGAIVSFSEKQGKYDGLCKEFLFTSHIQHMHAYLSLDDDSFPTLKEIADLLQEADDVEE